MSDKRTAGRPKVIRDPPPIRGIMEQPDDPNNSIEFTYGMPLFVKHIWQIFKKMRAEKTYITFLKDKIVIRCRSHDGSSLMRCMFDCNIVSSYYCEDITSITVDCQDFASITKKIDAKFNDFQLYCQKGNQHSITVQLTPSNGMIEKYNINLTDEYEEHDSTRFDYDNYMIHIKMGCKYLKRTITEIKRNVRLLSFIQEDKSSPVFMQYHTTEGNISAIYEIQKESEENNKKKEPHASYISKLPENHIFRVLFRTENIRPFGASMPNEIINIYVDEKHPIKLHLKSPDESLDIAILMAIEDENS